MRPLNLSIVVAASAFGALACTVAPHPADSDGGAAPAAPSATVESASATASATASAAPTATSHAATPPPSPFVAGETWNGAYHCAQGGTSLSLVISSSSGNRVSAVFDFRKGATAGSFNMSGAYDPGSRHLHLSPGNWIHQPPNFVSVGLDGVVSPDGHQYSGAVQGPGCGGFSVRR